MNLLEMVSVFEEIAGLVSELQSSGLLGRIQAEATEAEAIAAALEGNANFKALITKLEGLFAKKA